MRKSRFSEEQIIAALKEHDAGAKVRDLCRKLGVSEHTFYRWRSKYGGMEVSDARKLKALEEENRRLKHIVADLTLDVQMLKAVNAKDSMRWPAYRRDQGGHDGPRRDRSWRQRVAGVRTQPGRSNPMGGALADGPDWRIPTRVSAKSGGPGDVRRGVRRRGCSGSCGPRNSCGAVLAGSIPRGRRTRCEDRRSRVAQQLGGAQPGERYWRIDAITSAAP